MGQRAIFIVILFAVTLVVNTNSIVGADVNVKLQQKIRFLPQSELPPKPRTFCVTEDELFILPDHKAGNIKIYEKAKYLELVKVIGRKGYGQGEFIEPTFCFYNRKEGKFGVFDFGRRKILLYDRIGKVAFEFSREFYCLELGTDMELTGETLLVAGYHPDPNNIPYDLYSINSIDNRMDFLLPSWEKYGLQSLQEYGEKYRGKDGDKIKALGINVWFDVDNQGDHVYFIWEGNALRIIKLNIESKELIVLHGKETPHYKKPSASEKLLEARRKRDVKTTKAERAKISFVTNLFVNSKYFFLIYEGPNQSNFRLQFYNLDGKFIDDVPLPGQPESNMWFDRHRNILYALSSKEGNPEEFFILKYKISD